MANWLLKTEPGDFSYADLERDGGTVWNGVSNNWALKNLRAIHAGDRILIYHTGNQRAVVGEAIAESDPYADPALDDPKMVVIDIRPVHAWENPVALVDIKSDPVFSDFDLVRFSRLSVVPVSDRHWNRLAKLAR